MTTETQQVAGALLVAVAPSYATSNPYYASPLADRSLAGHTWLLVARLGQLSSYTSDAVRMVAITARTLEVAEIVRSLRDGGIPVAALAEMMLVERKSVYAWLDGGEVRPANEARARAVHGLLAPHGPDITSVWRVSARPLASGTSLRKLLSASTLDVGAVASALDELRPAIERHVTRDAGRSTVRGLPNPALSDLPVAYLGDEAS